MIEATPENWDTAELNVRRAESDGTEKMEIEITNPKGLREIVGPTEEIYTALYALSDCFRAHGVVWREAQYSVNMNGSGEWAFKASFAY